MWKALIDSGRVSASASGDEGQGVGSELGRAAVARDDFHNVRDHAMNVLGLGCDLQVCRGNDVRGDYNGDDA